VVWNYRLVFGVMILGYFTHWVPERWKQGLLNGFIGTPLWAKVLITVGMVFLIYQAWSSDLQPFIYFQF
jgi:alginate O-acetyltransferase complex protein AlgI